MDPIVGVLVGGGIALVSNVLTQLWTSRRDTRRQDREEGERRKRELASARAEWAGAAEEALGAAESDDAAWTRVQAEPDAAVAAQRRADRAVMNRQLQDAKARLRAATTRLLLIDTYLTADVDPLAVEAEIVELEHSRSHQTMHDQAQKTRTHLRAVVQVWTGQAAAKQLAGGTGATAALPPLPEPR